MQAAADPIQPNALNLIQHQDFGLPHDEGIRAALRRAMLVRLRKFHNVLLWLLSACLVFSAISPTVDFFETFERESLCQIIPVTPARFLGCEPEESFTPDFRKLVTLQSQLQGAMEKSTNTLAVAIDLKHSEIAVRDLTTLVQLSSLVTKDSLTKNLKKFVKNASTTGRNLQKFAGHVGSAVDQTIAMNEYMIEMLESMAEDEKTPPLTLRSLRAPAFRNSDIKSAWFEATEQMKSTVQKLIDEAMANEQALNDLDNELTVIHQIVARADNKVLTDRAETGVTDYRKMAVDHVHDALFQLRRIDLDLNELNEQVTAPLLAKAIGLPLDMHIGILQKGTARLVEGRAREREREAQYTRGRLRSTRS
ncbi:hypothetical protein FRC09_016307 [Ceratobasidium sp. 395]|nr:hypothetical protein FRC09_016307 [Ceratobasidium sp. 395]